METTLTFFDTHAYIKRLRNVGFTEAQAEVLADEQARLIEERLATKRDLKELELHMDNKLETKLAETKAELIKWMFGVAAGQLVLLITIVRLLPSH